MKNKLMPKILLFFILGCSFFSGCTTFHPERGTWKNTLKQAEVAAENHECTRFWNLIWPWEQQSAHARAILAAAMHPFFMGLRPPGTSDVLAWRRHYLILVAYAAADGNQSAIKLLKSFLKDDLLSGAEGKRVIECLDSKESPRSCINIAVKEKILPDFEIYVKEVNAIMVSGFSPVSCEGIHDYRWKEKREDK